MTSTRLPGKVLADVTGTPMIGLQIARLRRSERIDEILVATSLNPLDDPLVDYCERSGVKVFRGSENDVLSRVAGATLPFEEALHVECFGDSPLIDPQIIDLTIEAFLQASHEVEVITNSLTTSYPPGMETSIYSVKSLQDLNQRVASEDPLREHVGFNFTRFKEKFRVRNLRAPQHQNYPELYLEVDTPIDLEVVRAICSHFNKIGAGVNFGIDEIIQFALKNPRILEKNLLVERRWRKFRS
jgi:spore coat polysaccharide biosynthesis protein SpsF